MDNPLQDAWAYVWVVNGAGNDTVIYLHYTAPKLSFLSDQGPKDDSINFINSPVGSDTCARMVFKNLGQPGGETFHVTGYHFTVGGQGFRVTSTTPALPAALAPGDSIVFDVCFNAAQPAQVYKDTLIVATDCPTAITPLLGSSRVGNINASDYDFGPVLIGHTVCHTVQVWNTGAAPITLTTQWVLDNMTNFTFADSAKLPLVLDTGIANAVKLTFCYTPTDTTGDSTQQHWGSSLPEPFTQINKDFSILKGRGIKPALNWNIPLQHVTTECDTPRTFRSILSDSGTAPITVDSLGIIGPDVAEFSIVGTQSTPQFTLYPVQSTAGGQTAEWVDVKFTPDLSKPLATRWADRYDTLVAYDQDSIFPLVVLFAEVSHSEVDLPQSLEDLGMSKPGVPTQTHKIVVKDTGDAPLIIQQITIDTPFTIVPGSLAVGDTINPRGSDTIIVQGTMSWNGTDTGFMQIYGTTTCGYNKDTIIMHTSNILAYASGTNVKPTYICLNSADSVSVSVDNSSVPVKVDSAQIVDDPAHPGESTYFTFSSSGSRSLTINNDLSANGSQKYGILYTPTLKEGDTAEVIFTVDTASNPGVAPWTIVRMITGSGIQEHTTISVQNPQTGAYSAYTNSIFQVPVQMTLPIADGADVRTITMDITFKRDLFEPLATPVVATTGYMVVNSQYDQSNDPAVLHLTLARNGNVPFDSTGVLANLQLKVMVAKDTATDFVISNVTFQNSAGDNLCYVLHDTIPATFIPGEYCQNGMLRRFLLAGVVSLGIQSVHPNPAANTVHLVLDVHEDGVPMTIELYNSLGQLVRSYGNGAPMPAGAQGMDLDLSDVPSGPYSLRVLTPDYTVARTLMVQK